MVIIVKTFNIYERTRSEHILLLCPVALQKLTHWHFKKQLNNPTTQRHPTPDI